MREKKAAMTARNLIDNLARDRVMLENEARRIRGPRAGHNVNYNEVQKKFVQRKFVCLARKHSCRKIKMLKTPKWHSRKSRNYYRFHSKTLNV